jgi:serralysin
MKHQFIPNLQNRSDSFFDAAGDQIDWNLLAATSNGPGNPPTHVPVPPPLVLSSETIEAEAAQSGPVTATTVTSGGITINLLYDAAAMAAPQSFRDGIQQAAALLTAAISDKITVNIKIDYSGTGGGAAAGPDNGQYESYSSIRADLINNATPGDTTFNALPSGSSIQGQSSVVVWNAQLKLYGLLGANDTTTDDGSATFATDINPALLVGVALHELTHALGRVPYGPQPDVFDLYRFTSAGTRLFTDNIPASTAYFSVNGGTTKLADYGRNSDPSDFLNTGVQGSNDPFNEFYSGSTLQTLTAMDLRQLDAMGFHTMSSVQQTIVVAATASQAVQGGTAVTLLSGPPTITDSASTTLSSATIKITNASGSAVAGDKLFVNGVQNGSVGSGVTASWNAATDTLTLTGSATLAAYDTLLSEISYQDTGTDTSTGSHPARTVTWAVNDGTTALSTTSQIAIERAPVATVANVVLNGLAPVAASSLLTASDPDSDAIATYAFKDTGNGHFLLNGVVQANNQEIDVTAAQLSQLTYQSTGGSDSLQVRVNDGTLWSAWQGFTVTATAAKTIESYGSTSLVEVGSNYYLDSISTGTGPELKYGGAAVSAGQFGSWTPVGTEQTATGYEVAFQIPGTQQFAIWNTDSSGNETSLSTLSGTSTALETLETSFHQDLNGDGVIGVPGATGPATQPSVTIASNDTFVFPPAGGASLVTNADGAVTTAFNGFFSSHDNQAALFQSALTGQAQSPPQSGSDVHDITFNSVNHDNMTWVDAHIADLHANSFIIR